MSAATEVASALSGGSRVIVISEKDVDLRPGAPDNCMFLLKIGEGSLAAGGRGGGFGERRVVSACMYRLSSGAWSKEFEADEAHGSSSFEVPYHVSRLPMYLAGGEETMGYGVVDPELVKELAAKSAALSS